MCISLSLYMYVYIYIYTHVVSDCRALARGLLRCFILPQTGCARNARARAGGVCLGIILMIMILLLLLMIIIVGQPSITRARERQTNK